VVLTDGLSIIGSYAEIVYQVGAAVYGEFAYPIELKMPQEKFVKIFHCHNFEKYSFIFKAINFLLASRNSLY